MTLHHFHSDLKHCTIDQGCKPHGTVLKVYAGASVLTHLSGSHQDSTREDRADLLQIVLD